MNQLGVQECIMAQLSMLQHLLTVFHQVLVAQYLLLQLHQAQAVAFPQVVAGGGGFSGGGGRRPVAEEAGRNKFHMAIINNDGRIKTAHH